MLRPAGRFLLHGFAGAVAGVAILFALTGWLLSQGPISLAFLKPYVQSALTSLDTGFSVEFDDVVLAWAGWQHTLDVRVVGVRVSKTGGPLLASLPEVSIGISGRDLLRGAVVLTSLDFIGARARIARDAEGKLDLGVGDDAASQGEFARSLIRDLAAPPSADRLTGRLRSLSIRDGALVVDDAVTGHVWRASRANIILLRDQDGVRATAQMRLLVGDERVPLVVNGRYDPSREAVDVEAAFDDVDTAALHTGHALLAPLAGVRVPASGRFSFQVDLAGAISDIAFSLTLGRGTLSWPETFSSPVAVKEARAHGLIANDLERVRLDEATLELADLTVEATGQVGLGADHSLDVTARAKTMTLPDIDRLWPRSLVPDTHAWVADHLRDGRAHDLKLHVVRAASGQEADDRFEISLDFEGLTASYYRSMPPLTKLAGTLHFDGTAVDVTLAKGAVGGLPIGQGRLRLLNLHQEEPTAEVAMVISGPVRSFVAILDNEALKLGNELAVRPAAVDGMAATRLELRFPLRQDLTPRMLGYAAAANFSGLALRGLRPGYDLSQGSLSLAVDGNGMRASGTAAINGVPVGLAWERRFAEGGGVRSRLSLRASLDAAARQALLVPSGDYLSGTVDAAFDIVEESGGTEHYAAELGLKQAQLRVPSLHWTKEPGVDGRARLQAERAGDGAITVTSFELAAGDLSAAGSAKFAPDWALRELRLSRLAYAGTMGTPLRLGVSRKPGHGIVLSAEGEAFDARPYLSEMLEPTPGPSLPMLEITARLQRLRLSDTDELRQAAVRASYDGSRIRELQLGAHLVEGPTIEVAIAPKGAFRTLRVRSPDAGAVGRAFGLFDNAYGGSFDLAARIRDDVPGRPIEGRVVVRAFKIVGAAVLARILSGAAVGDADKQIIEKGIAFDRFSTPFRMVDGQISLKEARAVSSTLGITAEGLIDRRASSLELRGTLVPAYGLNALPGKIPLLGQLLVGKKGEGVFGLTYTVKGPLDNPKVDVNPMAALAPGVLRRLFEGGEGLPERDYDVRAPR